MKKIIHLFLILSVLAFSQAYGEESKLIIIRHGQGVHNVLHQHNSNPLHPNYFRSDLTDLGRKQVAETAEKLKALGFNKETIELVIVSPLPRTLQTAQILAEQGIFDESVMVIDSRVTEGNAGELEGQSTEPTKKHKLDLYFRNALRGETDQEIKDRMENIFRAILKRGAKGHVLIITHRGPARELIHMITGDFVGLDTAEAKILPLRPFLANSGAR